MIRPLTTLGLALVLPLLAATAAAAQAQTGTGGSPASTATAPNTSSVGRVMPPSRGAGAATPDDRRVRTPREAKNDRLMRGICIGCAPR
ncbi:hypothetical protein ACXR8U_13075 [Methylobacterium radiotolerans]|jgi:hypothetical protein|uniref:hypothetical protein n=1 Tax=Methylobacterium TaxID=407 RepID=UPI0005E403C0|nr:MULTISPECIES: hypothetical protein [Methylobacterium]GAN49352.1 hypothetical protein ME121_3380 [Methylobacterium sp. ME121]KTS12070.1 hypothetical protein SB3_02490 [Methylobacterium radiotolerans]KTS48782.1 hypothetical protein SB2_09010 [Methylobacterium radiotolerans]MBN6820780.1 hypothetical protein [Methylobacterium organophilum]OXE41815.1 hypothetical protein CCS92_11050 [Methylobacterium radiotolerans]